MTKAKGKTAMSLHIPSDLYTGLKQRAMAENKSLSRLCTDIFEQDAQDYAHGVGVQTFYPQIEKIIHAEVAKMSNRLAKILVNTSVDTATHRLFHSRLAREVHGLEQSKVNRMMNTSYKSAIETLNKRAAESKEILAALDTFDLEVRERFMKLMQQENVRYESQAEEDLA